MPPAGLEPALQSSQDCVLSCWTMGTELNLKVETKNNKKFEFPIFYFQIFTF